jgi:hypothetical protein
MVLWVGTWRSQVAHTLGVRGVGGSNPPVPTILHIKSAKCYNAYFSVDKDEKSADFADQ